MSKHDAGCMFWIGAAGLTVAIGRIFGTDWGLAAAALFLIFLSVLIAACSGGE